MWQDMGDVTPKFFEDLRTQSEAWLRPALASGEYVGWLAHVTGEIIAGAGVQLRRVMPHPAKRDGQTMRVAEGRHGLVINVFTEPAWRRRGVSGALLAEIIRWATSEQLDRLTLHASPAGQPLYQRFGFVRTNEMRLEPGAR